MFVLLHRTFTRNRKYTNCHLNLKQSISKVKKKKPDIPQQQQQQQQFQTQQLQNQQNNPFRAPYFDHQSTNPMSGIDLASSMAQETRNFGQYLPNQRPTKEPSRLHQFFRRHKLLKRGALDYIWQPNKPFEMSATWRWERNLPDRMKAQTFSRSSGGASALATAGPAPSDRPQVVIQRLLQFLHQ